MGVEEFDWEALTQNIGAWPSMIATKGGEYGELKLKNKHMMYIGPSKESQTGGLMLKHRRTVLYRHA